MSEIKVNKISPRSGTEVTLGDSGDTFTIPSGATINNQGTATNFGATGSASWVTTKKTATFTATAGEGYFCDTAAVGAFTVNLPSSPSAGAVVAVADYANTFDTANLTIGRGGSNIEGEASDFICNVEGAAITLVYVDATKGWITTDTGQSGDATQLPAFVSATGGTVTTVCTNFKVHTFTGPGTFTVANAGNSGGSNLVDYLVIAGGANAGGGEGTGGGGAGGYRESGGTASGCYSVSPLGSSPSSVVSLSVTEQAYPIVVGAGGTSAGACSVGNNGSDSSFSTIVSTGGGGGGAGGGTPGVGANGGSGGGGGGRDTNPSGNGNTPPVSPPQGQPGGNASPTSVSTQDSGGGGGGATVAGTPGAPAGGVGGNGGTGATSSINGTPTERGGGGSGGSQGGPGNGSATGGGSSSDSGAGTANTGGGGGGSSGTPGGPGGTGGSGIVIIRYKFQ
jgi:hypothetical protein